MEKSKKLEESENQLWFVKPIFIILAIIFVVYCVYYFAFQYKPEPENNAIIGNPESYSYICTRGEQCQIYYLGMESPIYDGFCHDNVRVGNFQSGNLACINHFFLHSEESKKIMSEKARLRLSNKENHPFFKKVFSREHRNKLSLAHLGEKNIKASETKKRLFKEGKLHSWNKGLTKETNLSLKKMSESRFGKNNPSWNGGTGYESYNSDFNIYFKNSIRKRDNWVCMNCGIHREKLKRALSIHHVNYDKYLTLKENCISLCSNCHSLTNYNREYWQGLFQEKLSKLYGYKYERNQIKIELNKNYKHRG